MRAGDAMREGMRRLKSAGLESAGLDVRILLAHELGLEADIMPLEADRMLTTAEMQGFQKNLDRRAACEPVARITGVREFWSLPFGLNEDTLVPRPDSETLVEAVLKTVLSDAGNRNRPLRLLDMGTGSGCLLLALLSELQDATGVGTDIAVGALSAARANADRLGLAKRTAFIRHDWQKQGIIPHGPFDVIVSNPPYIPEADIEELDLDVRGWDPRLALSGGVDGLGHYGRITGLAAQMLGPGAWLFLEHGAGQDNDVSDILEAAGFARLRYFKDLAGRIRVTAAIRG